MKGNVLMVISEVKKPIKILTSVHLFILNIKTVCCKGSFKHRGPLGSLLSFKVLNKLSPLEIREATLFKGREKKLPQTTAAANGSRKKSKH